MFKKLSTAAWSVIFLALIANAAGSQSLSGEKKFFPDPVRGIESRYIVLLNGGGPLVESRAEGLTRIFGGRIERIWDGTAEGFLTLINEKQARAMSRSTWVDGVYQDSLLYPFEVLSNDTPYCYGSTKASCPLGSWVLNERSFSGVPQNIQCLDPDPEAAGCIDNWGLDRLDHSSVTRDGIYDVNRSGQDIHVYLIDTGVRASHSDFGDRVTGGHNMTLDEDECSTSQYPPCGSDTYDYYGHGTHVAGIVAGMFAGVAKNVWIHPVRVVNKDCQQLPESVVMDALEWVHDNHPPSQGTAVVNLSMNNPDWGAGEDWESLRRSARGLASRDDVLLVQSAGNGDEDACLWSFGDEESHPAGTTEYESTARILVVAGSNEKDGRWLCDSSTDENCTSGNAGSNYGRCVDVFAPASHIVSAFRASGGSNDDQAVCRLSGTSMAAPHVTGVAALYLEDDPSQSVDDLRSRILSLSWRGLLESNPSHLNFIGDGSTNLLIQYGDPSVFRDGFESGDTSAWPTEVP